MRQLWWDLAFRDLEAFFAINPVPLNVKTGRPFIPILFQFKSFAYYLHFPDLL